MDAVYLALFALMAGLTWALLHFCAALARGGAS